MREFKRPMDRVFRLINAGQMEQAEQLCRQVLESEPENINLLGMLGAILLKQDNLGDAENCLKKAIELAPTFAKAHEDLGMLYLSQNQAARASEFFEKAIQLDPTQASAYFGLANALFKVDRKEDAESAHRKYLEMSPTAKALSEASRLRQDGKSEHAEAICDAILKQEPGNVEALRMLARIAADDGRQVIAEGLLRRVVGLSPGHSVSHEDLGRFLADNGRVPEAIGFIRKAIDLDPLKLANHLMLADALTLLGRNAEALESYEHCLALEAEEPSALLGMGHLLRIRGRRNEAVACYRKCAAIRPDYGNSYWSLASLKDFRFTDQEVADMRSRIDSGDLDPESEVNFHFAVARAYEAEKDFESAWQEYERGNILKRSRIQYDPVENETKHDNVLNVFTGDFLEREFHSEKIGPSPIFILGMPRSGSTLIEHALASHSLVEGAGELPHIAMLAASLGNYRPDGLMYPEVLRELNEDQFIAIGKSYVHQTAPHRMLDTPYFTDKTPANFSRVGFIHLVLPNSRIIDARRDPVDTCIGNYRQLFAMGKNQSYDLQELGEYYLQYIRMMDHWDRVLPGRILRVQYEDVVNDLDGQLRRILDYCELPWEKACLDFFKSDRDVNTASSDQVRQPIYKSAIGYWKNYESHLAELIEILAPVLRR